MRLTMRRLYRLLLITYMPFSCFFVYVALAQTPAAKPSPASSPAAQKTAGEAMKNVQVLKDIPESEWNRVMFFISGSLGVSCDHCHAQQFDSDAKKAKLTARSMMKMTHEINAANFDGRPVVTCNTCHRGNLQPKGIPDLWNKTPEELAAFKKQRETDRAGAVAPPATSKGEPLPAADRTFSNYREAVAAVPVHSIHLSGALASDMQQSMSLELEALPPDKVLVHNSLPGGVDIRVIGNGERGWTTGPQGTRELPHSSVEALKVLLNTIVAPVKFTAGPPGKVIGTENILGRTYTVVELEAPNELDRLYFDAESGLLYKARLENRIAGFGITPTEIFYEDYRVVNGVKFPFSVTSRTAMDHVQIKFSEIQTNMTLDPSKFEPPPKPTASK